MQPNPDRWFRHAWAIGHAADWLAREPTGTPSDGVGLGALQSLAGTHLELLMVGSPTDTAQALPVVQDALV